MSITIEYVTRRDFIREMKCLQVQRSLSNQLIGIVHMRVAGTASIEAPTLQIVK